MTQPTVEVFANRWVALAASGTPSSASDSFQLFDGKIGTGIALIERPRDNPVMTADDRVAGKETCFVEGDFSIQPPTTPGSAAGISTLRIVSLLVAPSARLPSRMDCGTAVRLSSAIDDIDQTIKDIRRTIFALSSASVSAQTSSGTLSQSTAKLRAGSLGA